MKKFRINNFYLSLAAGLLLVAGLDLWAPLAAEAASVRVSALTGATQPMAGTEVFAIDDATTSGKKVTIDQMGRYTPVLTFANLPAAASSTGYVYRVSDANNAFFVSDGSHWKSVTGEFTLSMQTAVSSASTTGSAVETIFTANGAQALIPGGMLYTGCKIKETWTMAKSANAEAIVIKTRVGTAGTTADTTIVSGAVTASNQSFGITQELLVVDATTLQKGGNAQVVSAMAGGATVAFPSAVTISNISNPLYVTVGVLAATPFAESMTMRGHEVKIACP